MLLKRPVRERQPLNWFDPRTLGFLPAGLVLCVHVTKDIVPHPYTKPAAQQKKQQEKYVIESVSEANFVGVFDIGL